MGNLRIPLITGRPGPSGPTLTAEGFGAAQARGLGSLGQGISTGVQATVKGLSEIVKVDQQIEDAKQDQILWEKTARGQAAIDEARFGAEDAVPSQASLEGKAQTKIKDPKTLIQEYQSLSAKSIAKIGEGLTGLRREAFESRMRIATQDGLLKVRQVERARNIDEGRAAFERQEETLLSLAADPNADINSIIEQKKQAVQSAKDSGLWGAHEMELNRQGFEKDARRVHEAAQFNAQVDATVEGMMSLNLQKNDRVGAVRATVPDGKLQDEIVRRVKLESDEEQGRIVQGQKDQAEASWRAVREGGGEASILPGITEKQRRMMDTFIKRRAEEAAKGAVFVIATDPVTYNDLLNKARTDPAAFQAINMLDFRMRLKDKDFAFFDKLQGTMATDPSGGDEGQAIFGISELTNTMMNQSKIENDDTRNDLRLQVIQDAQFAQERKGSPLTFREEELIVSKRVGSVNMVDEGWFFFDERKMLRDLTVKDRAQILKEPDARLIEQAREGLKRNGIENPTVEQVDVAIDSWLTIQGVPVAE